ncbi:MAG: hypothetical protein KKH68_06230 [Proteobacteria bacterium]|nr:hypothetical protein [Pseudomonadota bacterium]
MNTKIDQNPYREASFFRARGLHIPKRIIPRALCVTLALLVFLSPFVAASAAAPTACEKRCRMNAGIRAMHAAADSKSSEPLIRCCSGLKDAPCDFKNSRNFDTSDDVIPTARPDNQKTSFTAAVAGEMLSGGLNRLGFSPLQDSRASPRSVPIYLQHLTLLF